MRAWPRPSHLYRVASFVLTFDTRQDLCPFLMIGPSQCDSGKLTPCSCTATIKIGAVLLGRCGNGQVKLCTRGLAVAGETNRTFFAPKFERIFRGVLAASPRMLSSGEASANSATPKQTISQSELLRHSHFRHVGSCDLRTAHWPKDPWREYTK